MGPIIASGLSLVTLGTLLWFLHQHDIEEHAKDFDSDVESAMQSVRLHLRSDEDHITLLASELAREGGDGEAWPPGELLEHAFALLALLHGRETMQSTLSGLRSGHVGMRGTALELLESVLPPDLSREMLALIDRAAAEGAV